MSEIAPPDPFGLASPSFRLDPYPTWARLRAEAPVHFDAGWNGWLVTRYADVVAGFRDPRLSANRAAAYGAQLPPPVREKLRPLIANLSSWALLIDPPAHTRLRGLINKAFTPRVARELRPRIEALVEERLDRAAEAGGLDLIADLANPLPIDVIGELLGLPHDDGPRLKKWSDALAAFLGAGRMAPEIVGAALASIVELEAYFRARIEERRAAPGDDLLSSLIAAEANGAILDEQELLATCSMVLFGGHETTTNLIGNGVHHLLRDPDALAVLRAEPALIEAAVDELLRYDTPVQRMGRIALEDLSLAGQTIRKGDRVWLVMAAANRDPAQFPSPDRIDLGRRDNAHLAFGFGAHFCVGAPLGRLEAQIAIGRLVARFPRLAATEEPAWIDNLTIRGFRSLRLSIGGANK